MAEEITVNDQSRSRIGLILAGIATLALVFFVLQNTDDTEIDWLWFSWQMPKFLLIFITVALTLIVSVITAWILNRRSRRR